MADIVSELDDDDDDDDDVCSRLQVPVYNTLLRLFLKTSECPDVERGLYLLAASTPPDTCAGASTDTLRIHCIAIAIHQDRHY